MASTMYALSLDPIAENSVIEGSGFPISGLQDLGNGAVAFQDFNGQYISQIYNAKGKFETRPDISLYSTFGRNGNLITSWAPIGNGPVFTYFLVTLVNG
jgi:hypothetical protein